MDKTGNKRKNINMKKIAIVTGAAGGLGKEIVKRIKSKGFEIKLFDVRKLTATISWFTI